MKFQKEHALYISLLAISLLYLVLVDQVHSYRFVLGGQDMRFSFFDVVMALVGVVGVVLSVISFEAYNRKKDRRLFIIAMGFLFFTVKSIFNIIHNFFLGGYQFIGVASQTLELLMILAFFLVLFRK